MQRLKQELILGLQLLEAIIQLAQQQVGLRAGPSISQWQRLGVWGLIDGRIKALDAEGVLQLRGLTQALQRATQLLGLLGFSQRRQALVLALLLKALTLLGKAAQSPGRSQQRMAIAQVVLHLPFDQMRYWVRLQCCQAVLERQDRAPDHSLDQTGLRAAMNCINGGAQTS